MFNSRANLRKAKLNGTDTVTEAIDYLIVDDLEVKRRNYLATKSKTQLGGLSMKRGRNLPGSLTKQEMINIIMLNFSSEVPIK